LGLAPLTKVTVISPRSEYPDVARALAQFEDFHPLQEGGAAFDPRVQELTVRAVRLFAQADQAVKDLGLPLMPGQIDIIFRGVKIPRREFDARSWDELISKAEKEVAPMVEEVRAKKAYLQSALKEETDAENVRAALSMVSGFSSDLGGLSKLGMFSGAAAVVANERLDEFRKALPEAIFLTQTLSKEQSLAVVIVTREDATKLDKTIKILELRLLTIPEGYPQNPADAYRKAGQDVAAAAQKRASLEAEVAEIGRKDGTALLATRELAEVARKMLDDARVSGSMNRLATISGYIPAKKEPQFREMFGRWIVDAEPAKMGGEGGNVPTLLENAPGLGLFQPITKEQGIPGGHEVDPTPLVSFVFPIFFGMMFGDVGHGIILTLFFLLVRQRSTGTLRQWANLFTVAGLSSIVFGVIFGEFFELSFQSFVPIPPVVEIIHRVAGSPDSFNFPTAGQSPFTGVYLVMIVAILIGVAHLTTALCLDVYQGIKEHDRAELYLERVPRVTMYVSGVGYGLAFIGAGFHFNVLGSTTANPLLGISNNVLGGISLAVLLPSMLVLFLGKSIGIAAGRIKGSVGEALFNGGLELFERISQFLSNTISYVRLAVMLLVHAGLLLITNEYFAPWGGIALNGVAAVPVWVILNLLIITFEAFIVYVQDLRLHLYEFFTKFYAGTGTPFRKILPDRARFEIKWR
jgi:V/A-type H+/Na+-transporting ATPase subunit I